jgi:hypothetical protein
MPIKKNYGSWLQMWTGDGMLVFLEKTNLQNLDHIYATTIKCLHGWTGYLITAF